jgi:hypothetical protein
LELQCVLSTYFEAEEATGGRWGDWRVVTRRSRFPSRETAVCRERKEVGCIMSNSAMWMGPDERGTSTASLALVAVLLLVLLAAASQMGSAFSTLEGHRVSDAANVAAQQRQALQRSFAAAHGSNAGPQHGELRVQQQTQLAIAAQSNPAATRQQVRNSIASLPRRLAGQLGAYLFEIVPEDIRNLVEIFRKRAHQLVE